MPEPAADPAHRNRPPSPPLVAVAGWLLPGAGYWLIGHRARAIVVGATIITLFLAGTLIGGVRAIQVPGYGEEGGRLYVVREEVERLADGRSRVALRVREHTPGRAQPSGDPVVTNFRALLGEIGNKPWSICQVMSGPVALVGGAASVWASRPAEEGGRVARGVLSHGRINEIGVLYTAVAGMLNLLVIIDAAGRADDDLAASGGERSGVYQGLLGLIMLFRRSIGGR